MTNKLEDTLQPNTFVHRLVVTVAVKWSHAAHANIVLGTFVKVA